MVSHRSDPIINRLYGKENEASKARQREFFLIGSCIYQMLHGNKPEPYNTVEYRQVHKTYFLEHDPNSWPIYHHKALIKALKKAVYRNSKYEV